MKKTTIFTGIGIIVAAGVIYGATKISSHYLSKDKTEAVSCGVQHVDHKVIIQDNKMNPEHTDGKLCDTLTIQNDDDRLRWIAFGEHEHHTPYDGVTTRQLKKGESFTITLNKVGDYKFHDHLQDETAGTFTVTK